MSSLYVLNPAVAIEDFGPRSLALHCTELRLVELNATARDIVCRLDGKTSLDQLAQSMASEYNQPLEAIQADVQAIVDQMAEMGIVESVTPTLQEIENPCSSV
ncbi:MAG: PqqD family protein [Thermoflexales bacterium]|nr:PqqD family protein [Thermoflexales bacterium]